MTTAQRLKGILIAYLTEQRPDADISVIDAKQRETPTVPALAVSVPGVTPHSEALYNVERCDVEMVLRVHAGDEDDIDIDAWIDDLESALNDPSAITSLGDETTLHIYHWVYNGSTQDFSDAYIDTTFSAECLVTRGN